MAITYAPKGWASCQGQLLPIRQNAALFSLLGTAYGGNGTTTFALPDLRGRAAVGFGQGPGLATYSLGQPSGAETVGLTPTELPAHAHPVTSVVAVNTSPGAGTSPQNSYLAAGPTPQYSENRGASDKVMATDLVTGTAGPAGSGQPHPNVMPYLTLSYCIALEGVYPPRP